MEYYNAGNGRSVAENGVGSLFRSSRFAVDRTVSRKRLPTPFPRITQGYLDERCQDARVDPKPGVGGQKSVSVLGNCLVLADHQHATRHESRRNLLQYVPLHRFREFACEPAAAPCGNRTSEAQVAAAPIAETRHIRDPSSLSPRAGWPTLPWSSSGAGHFPRPLPGVSCATVQTVRSTTPAMECAQILSGRPHA